MTTCLSWVKPDNDNSAFLGGKPDNDNSVIPVLDTGILILYFNIKLEFELSGTEILFKTERRLKFVF